MIPPKRQSRNRRQAAGSALEGDVSGLRSTRFSGSAGDPTASRNAVPIAPPPVTVQPRLTRGAAADHSHRGAIKTKRAAGARTDGWLESAATASARVGWL